MKNQRRSDIIISKIKGDDVIKYKNVGKLKHDCMNAEFGKMHTRQVILMDERLKHIKERHPNDVEYFERFHIECIENPDIIIKDMKHEDTVFMIKSLSESNLNILIKLAVDEKYPEYKNSIITSYRLNKAKVDKLIRKNKLLYKKV